MPIPMNLRVIVRGGYDLQRLRIQMGNRLVGNFKAKLGQAPGASEETLDDESKKMLADLRAVLPKITDMFTLSENPESDEIPEEVSGEDRKAAKAGKMIVDLVSIRYKAVTDNRKTFPIRSSFKGDPIISNYTELTLIAQYVDLEKQEKQHFRRLENILEDYPIYTKFLSEVKGCGPMMSGVILSEIDIHKARHPSSLWKYAGLDVGPDGKGRSRRAEHLVDRTYKDKEGNDAIRKGITFQPLLKTKLIGVLGPSFLKCKGSKYGEIYYNYKHRLENHAVYKDVSKGHRHAMSIRYAVKQFLLDLHMAWRALEGLEVSLPYHEAKLGMKHGGNSAAP